MNATVVAKPHPLNLRAIYIASSQTTIGEHFDPLVADQPLYGWHMAQPDGARLNEIRVAATGKTLHTLEFKANFEFVYRTPKVDQTTAEPPTKGEALPPPLSPEDFEGMSLAAKVSATIVVSFLIPEGEAPPDAAAIVTLAQTTVLSVTWPYWREFCQTAFHRMQMPQTLIPLLTINHSLSAQPTTEDSPPAVGQEPTTSARSSAVRRRLRGAGPK